MNDKTFGKNACEKRQKGMDRLLLLWIFMLVAGFAFLVKGADWFVDGAAGIAAKCGVPALVIGLTVVAFGTSTPELATSITSAARSYSDPTVADISIGNVVGSNIANVLLILGLSALFRPLPVKRSSRLLDLPVLVLASALLIGLGLWGNALEWWDGLIMLAVFAVYMTLLFLNAKRERRASPAPIAQAQPPREEKGKPFAAARGKTWFLVLLTLGGLALVVGGGTLLVEGAKRIAEYFHADKRVVGLTVVAIGTSLPELVTSVVAAHKGETDIAVGNVIGSNIFNIFLVAGISSLVYPLPFLPERNLVDALVALAAVLLLCLCSCLNRHAIGRIGGGVMLAAFAAYYAYLFFLPA